MKYYSVRGHDLHFTSHGNESLLEKRSSYSPLYMFGYGIIDYGDACYVLVENS